MYLLCIQSMNIKKYTYICVYRCIKLIYLLLFINWKHFNGILFIKMDVYNQKQ